MEPRLLLQWLLDRDGDSANSLAARLNGKPSQPQIYKFLKGIALEPRRSTLEPVARHYRVPVEAFYDAGVADVTLQKLQLHNDPTPPLEIAGTSQTPSGAPAYESDCRLICDMFTSLPNDPFVRAEITGRICAMIRQAKDPTKQGMPETGAKHTA